MLRGNYLNCRVKIFLASNSHLISQGFISACLRKHISALLIARSWAFLFFLFSSHLARAFFNFFIFLFTCIFFSPCLNTRDSHRSAHLTNTSARIDFNAVGCGWAELPLNEHKNRVSVFLLWFLDGEQTERTATTANGRRAALTQVCTVSFMDFPPHVWIRPTGSPFCLVSAEMWCVFVITEPELQADTVLDKGGTILSPRGPWYTALYAGRYRHWLSVQSNGSPMGIWMAAHQ